MKEGFLKLGSRDWAIGERTGIFGILNVTPDSFSDGGRFVRIDAALAQARRMVEEGADVLDIGGESTKPGFKEVSTEEEIARVVPVIEAIAIDESMPVVSIDTTKAAVARAALEAGAEIVNDIWGLQHDPEMASVVAEFGASCVLMHNSRGGWRRDGVLDSISASWEESVSLAFQAGLSEDRIILDPGIGFTDTREQDLEIIRNLGALRSIGFPLLLGVSRKRITGEPFGLGLDERLETTLATTALGIGEGIDFVRVHDVKENVRVAKMTDLITRG
ncbi:MAG: dihydropteroate synthase [Opitutales bacterium]|jgi:dihydropteroate synthase|nr:dihydropteroate synthase [Opitutales bacterium]MBT5167602.1 dihydropteroate synthase [Opitutales bacterium]